MVVNTDLRDWKFCLLNLTLINNRNNDDIVMQVRILVVRESYHSLVVCSVFILYFRL